MNYREELFRLCRLVIRASEGLGSSEEALKVAQDLELEILREVYAEMSDIQFVEALKDISAKVIGDKNDA